MRYEALLQLSAIKAEQFLTTEPLQHNRKMQAEQVRYIRSEAVALTQRIAPSHADVPRGPAVKALELAAVGGRLNGWRLDALMRAWPFGDQLTAMAAELAGMPLPDLRVLEVGGHSGRLFDLIGHMAGEWVVTGREATWGVEVVWDFDQPAPEELTLRGPFDLVIAVDTLHKATTPGRTLEYMSAVGDRLVISEAHSKPSGEPHAMSWALGYHEGYWGQQSFQEPLYWESHGLTTAHTISDGHYDLGAVYVS